MKRWRQLFLILCLSGLSMGASSAQDQTAKVTIHWERISRVSQTTPTLQVVVNPPMRRGTPIHDNVFKALHDLQADYIRYVPWMPYPKLGVAELDPPANGKTSWDFSLIDPMTIDLLEATKGHSIILNFSTIPQWMYKTDKPVPYPADPNEATWNYEQGTELRDPSAKEVGDYFARLLSWYSLGGFTDELGKRHESGYRYELPYWEVLNEVEYEHSNTPESYTRIYDAVVEAIQKVKPDTKFVGLALATPTSDPKYFEYFLNHENHQPGIPLDFISYHFYALPSADETLETQQHTFFAQADAFLMKVRFIESIRQRLSPETDTILDEIGAVSADDMAQDQPGHVFRPIPNSYWNLTCATYAYLFGELTRIGIDVVGESQLVGYPTQYPSVSMVDWNTGKPNARYWVLKLLRDNFSPGDKVVETEVSSPYVYSFAVIKPDGKRRLLLVNKRDRAFEVSIPNASGGVQEFVDQTTGFKPPASEKLTGEKVTLEGYAVAVVIVP